MSPTCFKKVRRFVRETSDVVSLEWPQWLKGRANTTESSPSTYARSEFAKRSSARAIPTSPPAQSQLAKVVRVQANQVDVLE